MARTVRLSRGSSALIQAITGSVNPLSWQGEKGIDFDFEEIDERTDYHPNTVVITLTETDGTVNTLRGASVGGGEIEIHEINGCEIKFSAKNNAIIVRQKDKPGVIAAVAKVFENDGVNISYMSVYCEDGSDEQFSIIEIDGEFDEGRGGAAQAEKRAFCRVYQGKVMGWRDERGHGFFKWAGAFVSVCR